jgi:hypothetical protein
VGHNDRPLQRSEVLLANSCVGERAEAGIDAIDGVRAMDGRRHYFAACPHPRPHVRAKLNAGVAEGNIDDFLDGERVACDDHCSHG